MRKPRRTVQAHLDRHGIVIFKLMQGVNKPKIVHTFGYGTHHRIWLEVRGHGTGTTTMTPETAASVKEKIGQWGKTDS